MRGTRVAVVLATVAGILGAQGIAQAATSGPFSWEGTELACHSQATGNPDGLVEGRGTMSETGKSGTTQFRMKFVLQVKFGTSWVKENYAYAMNNIPFPDDSTDHSFTIFEQLAAQPEDQGHLMRLRLVFQWLSGPSKTVIHQEAVIGPKCIAGA